MKRAIFLGALAGWMWLSVAGSGRAVWGQNLLNAGAIAPAEASTPSESADAPIYADGVRAINEGRWADAIAIFSQIGKESGDHADGALFWKAYAENKLGHDGQALEDCGRLRSEHPASKWLDECGALEIEIQGKKGQPVQPQAQQSDDLKLLALATLMQHDEKKALQQIDEILNSDAPEKLKQGALFIMGEHHSDTEYPQIVRLSYVDGDVRIARGEIKKHDKSSGWEQATADLPLETGYSLVTGDGRAEIELEDASTIYLAENSVLMLNDLHTVGGVPYTEMALLTGTATLHVKPYVAGEYFVLHTPTDALLTKYPQKNDLRVSSYTDGIAITFLGKEGTLGLNGATAKQVLTTGQTTYFKDGKRTIVAGPIQAADFEAWDKWVADRYTARTEAIAEALKASGLTNPVPGLADLEGKGKFVDCQPYGTCWEPNPAPAEPAAETEVAQAGSPEVKQDQAANAATSPNSTGQGTKRKIGFIGKPMPTSSPAEWSQMMDMFPCMPGEVQAQLIMSRYPGASLSSIYSAALASPRWAWALCHAGSFIYRDNRYMWVAGRCHHHPAVHWIRYGDKVAFVPVHPHDVKNRAPGNHNNPVFIVNPKGGRVIERSAFPTGHRVDLLNEPPRGLRTVYSPPLQHVDEPRMTAHSLNNNVQLARGGDKTNPVPVRGPIPITFDHKSQTFMMAHQEMHGGRPVTVNAPISNHNGSLQSRAPGFSGTGSSSWNGGARSGGAGGVRAGGGSGTGGARGGGGGAGGGARASGDSSGGSGGGSHGSGGGGSGSSAGASGGAAASSGGSHH